MDTSAGIARTPYLATVRARVCDCTKPPKELGRFRALARALPVINGYWNVYIGFFGEQVMWLHFEVIDLRDGVVVWRDGRLLRKEEEKDGNKEQDGTTVHKGRTRGTWLVAGQHDW